MRSFEIIILWILMGSAIALRADNFELNDGRTITGEILASSANEVGLQIKIGEGKYEKLTWSDFSQATLKLLAQNPKFLTHVEPFIEIALDERVKKTEVPIKKDYPRLDLVPKGSLLGGLFGSSVGIFVLLLIYGANIYAGYEIAVVRAYSPPVVCGIAAVAPFVGPIIFLCLPTKMDRAAEAVPHAPAQELATSSFAGDSRAVKHPTGMHFADETAAPAATLPETQVFQRGQFTFNRRFIETKFGTFFGVVRRDADRDLQLLVKGSHGELNVHRISRISANDMHVEFHKGTTVSEVTVTFGEIQEIKLKHKDAH